MSVFKTKRILLLVILCTVLSLLSGISAPVQALQSGLVSITNNFGENPMTDRSFTWHTSTDITGSELVYCEKDYFRGYENGNAHRVKAVSYETKTDKDLRRVHKVALTGLTPGKEYVYRIVNNHGGILAEGDFKTAEKEINSYTFLNLTDSQGVTANDYAVWKKTLSQALVKFPDSRFLVHTGDMVDEGNKISQWDYFTSTVKEFFLRIPIAPVIGNHEILNRNNSNKNLKNFTERFNLPAEQNTGAIEGTVYSFDYGYAHIAVMNTQAGSKNLKIQAEWLRQDLKNTNKPWKIVALHRGLYGATYDTTDIRNAWGPVMDEFHVDLVLQGHDHNYIRSYPMKNKVKVSPGEGTVYLTGNSSGVKFYPQKTRNWQAVNFQPKTQMYIAVTVKKNQLQVEAYDVKNVLRDSVALEK